jgi:ArsR family transcriptional regulator
VAASLAAHVRELIAVDASAEMLDAARERLRDHDHVDIRQGSLEQLPIDDGALDAAIFMLVLHHIPDPVAALREAARVLKPHGKLLIVDMYPHEREEYKKQMGHVWLGFSEKTMTKHLAASGLGTVAVRPLPPAADAKGPALFTAVARKAAIESVRSSHEHMAGVTEDGI